MRLKKAGRKVPMAYMLKLNSAPEAMIHHRVGIRKTDQKEPVECANVPVSAAPLRGSGNVRSSGMSNTAGSAAVTIAARHPKACAIGPLRKKLSALPTGTPSMNKARTRDL